MRAAVLVVLGVGACGSPADPPEDLGPDGPCFMCEMGAGTPPDASAPFVPEAARLVQPPCGDEAARAASDVQGTRRRKSLSAVILDDREEPRLRRTCS